MDLNFYRLSKMVTFLSVFTLILTACGASEEVVVSYQYDALGRLSYVTDGVNGNRDYDYDRAGNRLSVAVNSLDDSASEPPVPLRPAKPTAFKPVGPLSPSGDGYSFSWTAVPGATSYQYALNGTIFTTTATSGSSAGPSPSG